MVKHMRLWLVAEAGGRVQAAMKAAGNEGGCFVDAALPLETRVGQVPQ